MIFYENTGPRTVRKQSVSATNLAMSSRKVLGDASNVVRTPGPATTAKPHQMAMTQRPMNTVQKLQKTVVKGTPKFAGGSFKTPRHKSLRFEIFQDDADKTPASDVQDELFAFDIQGELCQPAASASSAKLRLEPKTPACPVPSFASPRFGMPDLDEGLPSLDLGLSPVCESPMLSDIEEVEEHEPDHLDEISDEQLREDLFTYNVAKELCSPTHPCRDDIGTPKLLLPIPEYDEESTICDDSINEISVDIAFPNFDDN